MYLLTCTSARGGGGRKEKSPHVISPFKENDNEWDCHVGRSFDSNNGSHN